MQQHFFNVFASKSSVGRMSQESCALPKASPPSPPQDSSELVLVIDIPTSFVFIPKLYPFKKDTYFKLALVHCVSWTPH